MSLYTNLLQPELYYEQPDIARFVETLFEPEIDSASQDRLQKLKKDLMATDDINTIAKQLAEESKEIVQSTGTLPPQFIAYTHKEHRVKFDSGSKLPTSPEAVTRFLRAGKALAMSRSAHCIFFRVMQPLSNNAPAFGDDVTELSPWGIFVIGSSLRGNCFIHLERMTGKQGLGFEEVHHNILREGQYSYPYSKLYHIEDSNEMAHIINQTSRMCLNAIREKECLINFATTLKALDAFGYSVS